MNVFDRTLVGFEFEFYSDLNALQIKKKFDEKLNVNIILLNGYFRKNVFNNNWFLEKKYENLNLYELKTNPLAHNSAMKYLPNILKIINNVGYTTNDNNLDVNIGFPNGMIKNIPIGTLVMDFNESEIWQYFPDRIKTPFFKTIKNYSLDKNISSLDNYQLNLNDFNFMNGDGNFGININKDSFELKYIGGEDYHKKYDEIRYLVNSWVKQIKNFVNNPKISSESWKELKNYAEWVIESKKNLNSYQDFRKIYPYISIAVNLNTTNERLESYWYLIKDTLFELIDNGLEKGTVNYDSKRGRIQLKDADMANASYIEGLDIVNVNTNAELNRCYVYDSNLNSCKIDNSIINESKVNNCVGNNVEFYRCECNRIYLYGEKSIIDDCQVKNSLIYQSYISDVNEFDTKTKILRYNKYKSFISY